MGLIYFLDVMPQAASVGGLTHIFGTSVYQSVTLLTYALAALFGTIGGLRIYALWNISGRAHIHIDAQVVGWMSACIFFIISGFFISAVFNV